MIETAVQKDTLFCAMVHGILIFDVSDIYDPELLSRVYMSGEITYSVAVRGDLMCVGLRDSGVVIFDVSDPRNPQRLSDYRYGCTASGLTLENDLLFVSCAAGLDIIDLSDRLRPRQVGFVSTPNVAASPGLEVNGSFAYLAAADLYIIDISDPTSPSVVSQLPVPHGARDLALMGDHVAIASEDEGHPAWSSTFCLVNISDPLQPFVSDSFEVRGNCRRVRIFDDRAYVSAGRSGLLVFDVADPQRLELISCYKSPSRATAIAVTEGGVVVSDLHDDISGDVSFDHCEGQIRPDTAHVSPGIGDIQFLDYSNLTSPVVASIYPTSGLVFDMTANETHAFVRDASGKIAVFDVTGDSVIERRWACDLPTPSAGLQAVGDFLYVAAGASGLSIWDVHDVCDAQLVGQCNTGGSARAVQVSGSYAFVAAEGMGLYVVDVSQPSVPIVVGHTITEDFAADVLAAGSTVYVADRRAGIQIYDVSDPALPTRIGTFRSHLPAIYTRLAKSGSVLFTDGPGLLGAIDVSDPAQPVLLGNLSRVGTIRDLTLSGNLVFLGAATDGIQAIDVTNVRDMRPVAEIQSPGDVQSVYVSRNVLMVTDVFGFSRYRFESTLNSEPVPEMFALHQNHPNPFNDATVIPIDLRHRFHVRLSIFNILGEEVCTLLERDLPVGFYTVSWNGRDRSGRPVASGVYLYRLTAGEFTQTRKMVLVK